MKDRQCPRNSIVYPASCPGPRTQNRITRHHTVAHRQGALIINPTTGIRRRVPRNNATQQRKCALISDASTTCCSAITYRQARHGNYYARLNTENAELPRPCRPTARYRQVGRTRTCYEQIFSYGQFAAGERYGAINGKVYRVTSCGADDGLPQRSRTRIQQVGDGYGGRPCPIRQQDRNQKQRKTYTISHNISAKRGLESAGKQHFPYQSYKRLVTSFGTRNRAI